MNLSSGEIVEIYVEDGTTYAKVRVKGTFTRVPLIFLPEVRVGDTVLIDSGVAISKVEREKIEED